MRYDKPIFFQTVTAEYDPATGNYNDEAVENVQKYASVMDSSAQTLQLVYGGIKQGSLTIHLQRHYNAPFDRICVDGKLYKVDSQRKLRRGHTFVVSEVQ
jgi:hypothetical protein